MPSQITFPEEGFLAHVRDLHGAASDPSEILPELEKIAWQDNRDGLLKGLDRDGRPFKPLSPTTIRYRRSAVGKADPNAPPLIPCRERSRLIANYRVGSVVRGRGVAMIVGYWDNVLSSRGLPFIQYHMTGTKNKDGSPRMPRRNPDGVRPDGMRKMSAAMKAWFKGKIGRP